MVENHLSMIARYFPFTYRWLSHQSDSLPWRLHVRGVSLLSCAVLLYYFPHWHDFFALDGRLAIAPHSWSHYSLFQYGTYVWWWMAFIASATLSIERIRPLAALTLMVIQFSMYTTNWVVLMGEERLLRVYLPLIFLLPHFSHDRLPQWQLCLLRWQVAMVYFWAGLTKYLSDPGWINGSAVFYSWNFDLYSRLPVEWTESLRFLSPPLSWATLWFEGTFPIVFLHRYFRRIYFVVMMGFHFGVLVTMRNVEFFNLMMMAGLVLFLQREDIALYQKWWSKALRRWPFVGRVVPYQH